MLNAKWGAGHAVHHLAFSIDHSSFVLPPCPHAGGGWHGGRCLPACDIHVSHWGGWHGGRCLPPCDIHVVFSPACPGLRTTHWRFCYEPGRPWTVLDRSARFCQILPDSEPFCQVLPDSEPFCQILPGSERFCQFHFHIIYLSKIGYVILALAGAALWRFPRNGGTGYRKTGYRGTGYRIPWSRSSGLTVFRSHGLTVLPPSYRPGRNRIPCDRMAG